jgi:hypothetical protein
VEELNKGMQSGAKMLFEVGLRNVTHVRSIQSSYLRFLPEEYGEDEYVDMNEVWLRPLSSKGGGYQGLKT